MTDYSDLVHRLRTFRPVYGWPEERAITPTPTLGEQAAAALEAQAKEIAALKNQLYGAKGSVSTTGVLEEAVQFQQGWADALRSKEKLAARIADLEAALKDATVHLIAAVSLLESGGKKGAPSNKMFEQMLVDYKNGVERARAALNGEK
jgi:hypothetical protein